MRFSRPEYTAPESCNDTGRLQTVGGYRQHALAASPRRGDFAGQPAMNDAQALGL